MEEVNERHEIIPRKIGSEFEWMNVSLVLAYADCPG